MTGSAAQAQSLGADFLADDSYTRLGSVPSRPTNGGDLTFLDNDTGDITGLVPVAPEPSGCGHAKPARHAARPEGFTCIAASNPGFSTNSLLLSEYSAGAISAYAPDTDGNPAADHTLHLLERPHRRRGRRHRSGHRRRPVLHLRRQQPGGGGLGLHPSVPEPASRPMLALGGLVLATTVRRRQGV